MIKFIIRERGIQRYAGTFGAFPSKGQFWYNPKSEFSLEITDGVKEKNSKRDLEHDMNFFFQDHEVIFKLMKDPNAKGMYEFVITCTKASKVIGNVETSSDREKEKVAPKVEIPTEPEKPSVSNVKTKAEIAEREKLLSDHLEKGLTSGESDESLKENSKPSLETEATASDSLGENTTPKTTKRSQKN